MKQIKPKNSALLEKFEAKLKAAQKSPLREGFLSQDKFPELQSESKRRQIS
jgi:hypothetical protein